MILLGVVADFGRSTLPEWTSRPVATRCAVGPVTSASNSMTCMSGIVCAPCRCATCGGTTVRLAAKVLSGRKDLPSQSNATRPILLSAAGFPSRDRSDTAPAVRCRDNAGLKQPNVKKERARSSGRVTKPGLAPAKSLKSFRKANLKGDCPGFVGPSLWLLPRWRFGLI